MKINTTASATTASATMAAAWPSASDGPCKTKPEPLTPEVIDSTQDAMHSAQQQLDSDSLEADPAQISQMQKMLESGDFSVDSDSLATAMMEFFQR